MAVHCRRGYGVVQKEVKQEMWLGVTDRSGHARGPNLSFVRLAEGNEYGGISRVSPHFLHEHTRTLAINSYRLIVRAEIRISSAERVPSLPLPISPARFPPRVSKEWERGKVTTWGTQTGSRLNINIEFSLDRIATITNPWCIVSHVRWMPARSKCPCTEIVEDSKPGYTCIMLGTVPVAPLRHESQKLVRW